MPGITPNLDRLAREGVVFSECYANSYRTDRGVLSTLSGYPSFPQHSVMKMPAKSRSLSGIAQALQGVGYKTDFLYGGDANFTTTLPSLEIYRDRAGGYRITLRLITSIMRS